MSDNASALRREYDRLVSEFRKTDEGTAKYAEAKEAKRLAFLKWHAADSAVKEKPTPIAVSPPAPAPSVPSHSTGTSAARTFVRQSR